MGAVTRKRSKGDSRHYIFLQLNLTMKFHSSSFGINFLSVQWSMEVFNIHYQKAIARANNKASGIFCIISEYFKDAESRVSSLRF